MLDRLRRRFIWITLGLLTLVLIAIFIGSVINTWQAQRTQINDALSIGLVRGQGGFFDQPWGSPLPPGNNHGLAQSEGLGNNLGNRNPGGGFDLPSSVIVLDSNGQVITSNASQVFMDADLQSEALEFISTQSADSGLLLSLGLAYQRLELPDNTTVVAFTSTAALVNNTIQTALIMGLICLAAWLAIWAISILLSHIAMRPAVEAWERQRRFVADASHELKTPLAVILANTSILLAADKKLDANQKHWLSSSQVEAQHMEKLVRDLLELARLERWSDKKGSVPKPEPETIDFSDLVEKSLLQFEAIFFEQQLSITTELAAQVTVQGWRTDLEQLMSILLDNASKYAQSGGWVHVHLEARRPGHARLRISNSGKVIPEEKLSQLFERFYRGDESHSNEVEGFGLGLSLAQAITDAHHGSISITSDITNGTVVTLEL